MNFIIDGERIDSEDYSAASIYLDACFILAFLDKTDSRQKESARYLYSLAKKSEIMKFYRRDINISELIKLAKSDEDKRNKLDVFYNAAVNTFNSFLNAMSSQLGFKVEILDSLADPHYTIASTNMRIMQLDIIDSFHLAIAQENEYDFLATLDSDFVHNFYSQSPNLSTRIIKVA